MANPPSGYGQQDPADSSGEFNKDSFLIQQALSRISTAKPVIVRAVDASAKTVDVQPMVNQVDGQNNATPHGTIFGIPYLVLQYGTNAVKMTPAVGDKGVMICADRDISAVVATKDVAPPGSFRKLDAADGIFIGGILNEEPTQWIEFTDGGMEWHDKNANVLISSSTGWEFTGPVKFNELVTCEASVVAKDGLYLDGDILSADGDEYAGNLHTTGTVTGDTDVVSGAITLNTHRHVDSRGGDTGEPIP